MPKVSIIIPTYNVEEYLRQCMDSVINQTLKDIEIICIDDGSSDNSGKILDEYAKNDDRIKVIHKENKGLGHTYNVGMDNATGEYMGFVEPDDYVALNMYEKLYNIAKEKDLDLIKADFYRFIGDKKTYNKLDSSEQFYNQIIEPNKTKEAFNFVMNVWSGIYKRDFVEKYNIRYNETPGASFQDNGFWFQSLAWAKRAYFLNEPYYMNRRDNPNSSVKSKEKVFCMNDEYAFIGNILDKNPELKKELLGVYHYKKYGNYIWTFHRIDNKFKKGFLNRISKEFQLAYNNNEIDETLFNKKQLKDFKLIVKNPMKFYRKKMSNLSLLEKIFSIKNSERHKVVRIIGAQLKFKSKYLELEQRVKELENYFKREREREKDL